jgi:hypothetical protein
MQLGKVDQGFFFLDEFVEFVECFQGCPGNHPITFLGFIFTLAHPEDLFDRRV